MAKLLVMTLAARQLMQDHTDTELSMTSTCCIIVRNIITDHDLKLNVNLKMVELWSSVCSQSKLANEQPVERVDSLL